MERTLIKILILSVVLCGALFSAHAQVVTQDGVSYRLVNKAHVAEVVTGDTPYTGDVVIPAEISVDDDRYAVTGVGDWAFDGCAALTSVTLPASVTHLGSGAFSKTGLPTVALPNGLTEIPDNCFAGSQRLTQLSIPAGVTRIGGWAFDGCTALTHIELPPTVCSIGHSAFGGCTSLATLSLPPGVRSIEMYAFGGCAQLDPVVIPNAVRTVGDAAYSGDRQLTTLTIGEGVQKIASCAFSCCESLEKVTCLAKTVPTADLDIFEGSYVSHATLYVRSELLADYRATLPWKEFGNILPLSADRPSSGEKCAAPVITYEDGQLRYYTATEGAEVVSEVRAPDAQRSYHKEVALTATYLISAYAVKGGMANSDVVYASLVWLSPEFSDGLPAGVTELHADRCPVLLSCHEGVVSVSGLEDHTVVTAYTVDGRLVEMTEAGEGGGTLHLTALLGETVIIRIGDESVKLIVR